jgi:hypothetical protein
MILFFRHPKCPEVREKRRGVLGNLFLVKPRN